MNIRKISKKRLKINIVPIKSPINIPQKFTAIKSVIFIKSKYKLWIKELKRAVIKDIYINFSKFSPEKFSSKYKSFEILRVTKVITIDAIEDKIKESIRSIPISDMQMYKDPNSKPGIAFNLKIIIRASLKPAGKNIHEVSLCW